MEAACNISFCKRHEGYEGIVYFFSLPAASSWFSFVIYEFHEYEYINNFHFKKKDVKHAFEYNVIDFIVIFILTFLCFFLLDLANLVNIAAIKAAVEGAEKLAAAQLEFAKDRIIMGTERKSMFISDESRKACLFLLTSLFSK